jgi:formylglycine-generating enzyme required for sulfatase activity/uncharacterized caspase-like protein
VAKNWAITIGINQYNNLPNLNYGVADAEAMKDFLKQPKLGFEQVYHFADDAPPITDSRGTEWSSAPTFANLRSFLRRRFKHPFLNSGDNLWFFFAGHGIRHEDRDYLLFNDSDPDAEEIVTTAIPLHQITERLRRSGADNVILFLDACRNEAGARGGNWGDEKQQGVITIASCSPKERSYEIEQLGHGSFTYALLESLAIEGEGNCATVERLCNRLRERIKDLNSYYEKPRQIVYPSVEPASKYHLILLPQQATLSDINQLKVDAYNAEQEDLELARQLWLRVNVAARGSDMDAIRAFERLGSRDNRSTSSQTPSNPTPSQTPSKAPGERAGTASLPKPAPSVPKVEAQPTTNASHQATTTSPKPKPTTSDYQARTTPPKQTQQQEAPQHQGAKPSGKQEMKVLTQSPSGFQSSKVVPPRSVSKQPVATSKPQHRPSTQHRPSGKRTRRRFLQYAGLGTGVGVVGAIRRSLLINFQSPDPNPIPKIGTIPTQLAIPVELKTGTGVISLDQSFSFETVQADERGTIVKREERSAAVLVEDLGDGVKLEMVGIEAGSFLMGSPEGEVARRDSEDPQHEVNVPAFLMGRYPVTQAQWKVVAAMDKVKRDLEPDPAYFKRANNPVERVSWYDAVEFCARLSKATGRTYRLPTEAEWEYACRARTQTPFYYGETLTTNLANYNGNYTYGQGPKGEYLEKTTPVGSYPPNAWGLYGMHGNVWEWCLDDWHSSYEEKPEELKQNGSISWSSSDEDEGFKSLRGGSWVNVPRFCRSAFRGDDHPDDRDFNIGFRVVCLPARSLP